MGVDPDNYSFRELDTMATARLRADWDRTAVMWALMVNANSDPKKQVKPSHPADIHPFREREDYEDTTRDEDFHRDRRLAMLPETERARVIATGKVTT